VLDEPRPTQVKHPGQPSFMTPGSQVLTDSSGELNRAPSAREI
jgi:hypothetical protein